MVEMLILIASVFTIKRETIGHFLLQGDMDINIQNFFVAHMRMEKNHNIQMLFHS